jgi:hypothetical protein
MDVQLAVLADSANLSQEGKLNILGEFDALYADVEPVTMPLMYFVAKVRVSVGEFGNKDFVTVELRVVDHDGGLVAPPVTIKLTGRPEAFGIGVPFVGPIVVPIMNATFERFGTYTFELRDPEGHVSTAIPLDVRLRRA